MEILKKTYGTVCTLQQFISEFVTNENPEIILRHCQLYPTTYSLGDLVLGYDSKPTPKEEECQESYPELLEYINICFQKRSSDLNENVFVCQWLRTKVWKALYEVIGSKLMYFLCLKCSIFHVIKPDVFFQINGPSLYTCSLRIKKTNVNNSRDSNNVVQKHMQATKTTKQVNSVPKPHPFGTQAKIKNSADRVKKNVQQKNVLSHPPFVQVLTAENISQEMPTDYVGEQIESVRFQMPDSSRNYKQICLKKQTSQSKQQQTLQEKAKEASSKTNKDVPFRATHPISVRPMLYSHMGMRWPVRHVLSQIIVLQCCKTEALLQDILSVDVGKNTLKLDMKAVPHAHLTPILEQLIRKHQQTHHWAILRRLLHHNNSLANCVDPKLVVKYVRTILRRVIPLELLGSEANQKRLLSITKQMVLSGEYQVKSLGQIMCGVRVRDVAWLKSIERHSVKSGLMAHLYVWLLTRYALVAISSVMYVTPQSKRRFQLYFYPKSVWQHMHEQAVKELKSKALEAIPVPQPKEIPAYKVDEQRPPPPQETHLILRFIPKKKGMRPIMMKGSSNSDDSKKHMKKRCLSLLQYWIRNQQPVSIYPCDITVLHSKLQKLRKDHFEEGNPLYYVRLDIQDAYGSILQEKLHQIVTEHLHGTPQKLVEKRMRITRAVRNNPRRHVKMRFMSFLGSVFPEDLLPNCIVEEEDEIEDMDVKSVGTTILDSLRITVRCKGEVFRLTRGIPQGDVLSSALCNLYYGHMDDAVLHNFMESPDEIFIRAVDDYLYITPHADRASRFLTRMTAGIPEYGCQINASKTQTNVPGSSDGNKGHDHWFSFCGLQLQMTTFQVRGDYSGYMEQDAKYIMRMSSCSQPGRFLHTYVKKMPSNLKVQAVLLDPTYNPLERIWRNIWQACLMASLRCHAIVCHMPRKQPFASNPFYLAKAYLSFGEKLWDYLRRSSWRFGGDFGDESSMKSSPCIMGKRCKFHSEDALEEEKISFTKLVSKSASKGNGSPDPTLEPDSIYVGDNVTKTKKRKRAQEQESRKKQKLELESSSAESCKHLLREEVLYLALQAFYCKLSRQGGNYGPHIIRILKNKVDEVSSQLLSSRQKKLSTLTLENDFEV